MVRIGLVVALILVGALAGTTLSFAPGFLAIPIGVVALAALLLARARGAPPEEPERNRLGAPRQPFSERDRETLAP